MTGVTPIKEVLKKTIGAIIKENKSLFFKEDIVLSWQKVAGREAAKHSQPASIKNGVVIINVDSPVWFYQLNIKKNEIEKSLTNLLNLPKPLRIRLRAGQNK